MTSRIGIGFLLDGDSLEGFKREWWDTTGSNVDFEKNITAVRTIDWKEPEEWQSSRSRETKDMGAEDPKSC